MWVSLVIDLLDIEVLYAFVHIGTLPFSPIKKISSQHKSAIFFRSVGSSIFLSDVEVIG